MATAVGSLKLSTSRPTAADTDGLRAEETVGVKATATTGHRDTVELVLENVVMMGMVAEV